MTVGDRVRERSGQLTPAERRVAEVVVTDPQLVAFGTAADLAAAAGSGAATVVRLANKLDYDGYAGLQDAVQRDLSGQLRPAAERIRDQLSLDDDAFSRHARAEQANVGDTFAGVDPDAHRDVIAHLVDLDRPVLVLSGAASRGVALQFVIDLGQLRPGVSLLDGNEVDVLRALALSDDAPTIVTIDVRRYDRWVVDTLRSIGDRDVERRSRATPWIVALTDRILSPLAAMADRSFVIAAASLGPFDSHVGTLALLDSFVVGAAVATRDRATARLDRLEARWRAAGALTDD